MLILTYIKNAQQLINEANVQVSRGIPLGQAVMRVLEQREVTIYNKIKNTPLDPSLDELNLGLLLTKLK